jgi:ubiquinone/menaquinone biosynthesis C-methylase UbiE
MNDLTALYRARFSESDSARKDAIWKVLCEDFFQRYVPLDATLLEVASGQGEFLRHIAAARKLALDINPDAAHRVPVGGKFFLGSAENMAEIADSSVDVCFSSNFLEHLESKKHIDRVLAEIHRVLKPDGRYLCLQPNIRFCFDRYWDFYDHHTALSDRSLVEALQLTGFAIDVSIPKFLPYTTKSQFPQHPLLVRMYLKLPLAWQLLGKQCFVVARKNVLSSQRASPHAVGKAYVGERDR